MQVEIEPGGAWPLYFVDYNHTAAPGNAPPSDCEFIAWTYFKKDRRPSIL